jgi:uncharacterized coiled-coil protein SlyX
MGNKKTKSTSNSNEDAIEKYKMLDYFPLEIRSGFLQSIIHRVDEHLVEQEMIIEGQDEKIKELNKELGDRLDKDLKDSQLMIANVLSACVGTPSINSIGLVGATVIAKIRDMDNIKEVKDYIEQIVKDNEQELEKIQKGE